MYERGTILELKERRSTKDNLFPYDEVEVVGASPVTKQISSEWNGSNGQGVIITPLTEFAATIEEPFGKLQVIYKVKALPDEREELTQARVRDIPERQLGDSPEETFAKTSKNEEKSRAARPKKEKAKPSPLNDLVPEEEAKISPLD